MGDGDAHQEEASKATDPTPDEYRARVLRELAKVAFADIRRSVRWGIPAPSTVDLGDGPLEIFQPQKPSIELIASADIDDGTAAAISEVIDNGNGGIRVRMHDKGRALEMMARMLGMLDGGMAKPNSGSEMLSVAQRITAAVREMRDLSDPVAPTDPAP